MVKNDGGEQSEGTSCLSGSDTEGIQPSRAGAGDGRDDRAALVLLPSSVQELQLQRANAYLMSAFAPFGRGGHQSAQAARERGDGQTLAVRERASESAIAVRVDMLRHRDLGHWLTTCLTMLFISIHWQTKGSIILL
ncbi:hypothetical protein CYMTET_32775 [Cymbomonas tetramitiformis]|uniref:Uncharacterized protein n=1 Tax=Cymbomonas tetramitiformis TaxID=36881 RepID=A0AAE0FE64_9CHLO|nr:hypothetical protein CYMTET_32775 [Cymbomonas tetramitiformis]